LSSHENAVNEKVNAISKDAVLALSKFSDRYEEAKKNAKSELDKIRLSQDLIWRDGKPQDPAGEKVIRNIDIIAEIDGKIKSIEAVMQQIDKGREAKRPVEDLLRLVLNNINDSGFQRSFDGNDLNREMEIEKALRAQIEQFEFDRVFPHRDKLDQLKSQQLGDSHPAVITARNRLDKYEQELARRKAELRKVEEAFRKEDQTSRKEYPSVVSRLQGAYDVLGETLQKLMFERRQFKAEVEALKAKMLENQLLLSNYAISIADLEAVKEIAAQVNESLRAILGSETVNLEGKQPNSPHYASLLLTLTMIEERWYVTGVHFETEEGVIGERQKFLEANPKAISVPSPATR